MIFILVDRSNSSLNNLTPSIAEILEKHSIDPSNCGLAGDINLFMGRNNDDEREAELSIMIAE